MKGLTVRRVLFWLLAAASFLVGRYTGLRIFYIILFAQGLLIAAVLVVDVWTIRAFRFLQELDRTRAVKGGRVTLNARIVNETVIPLSRMDIAVDLARPGRQETVSLCVPPHSSVPFSLELELPYRGVYEVGMRKLAVTDVLGLTTLRWDMRRLPWYRQCRLTVLPRAPEGSLADRIQDEKFFGDAGMNPATTGDSINTARPYVEGDALKRVNWKVSARYGTLFVKQYESPARANVLVLVDNTGPEQKKERNLLRRRPAPEDPELAAAAADTACECAVAVMQSCLSQGRLAQLWGADRRKGMDGISATDSVHSDTVLLWLAELDFDVPGAGGDLLPRLIGQGSSLVVVSPRADNELVSAMARVAPDFDAVGLIAVGETPVRSGEVTVTRIPVGADAFALLSEEGRSG